MHVAEKHSHLGGYEHIVVHNPGLWRDLEAAVAALEANNCPDALCADLANALRERGWREPERDESRQCGDSLLKGRVAARAHFGESPSLANDLLAQHMAFYVGDLIDVGVEILPVKELQAQMSSGIAYYEGELYNLIRQGRGVPAVPLVLVGIAP